MAAVCDEQAVSLSDLPEPLLLQIVRQLEARDLATLCLQDRRLRQIAGEQRLWEVLAQARWPYVGSAAHHGDDWQQLYRHRVALPASFVTCVDRAHSLTARAAGRQLLRINSSSLPAASPTGSPVKSNVYGFPQRSFIAIPTMLLEQVMHMLFSLCLLVARCPAAISKTSSSGSGSSSSSIYGGQMQAALGCEMRLVRSDMTWWLSSKPDELVVFVKRTCDALGRWDMWGSGFNAWPEVMWKRSALQFLMDLGLGPEAGVCPSVTSKLTKELQRLDEVIRSVDAEGFCLETHRPAGLPPSHWWYWLRGQTEGGLQC